MSDGLDYGKIARILGGTVTDIPPTQFGQVPQVPSVAFLTPGPWFYRDEKSPIVVGSSDQPTVAHVGGNGERKPTRLANACLICAAPDLLKTVKDLVLIINAMGLDPKFQSTLSYVQSVIDKAEGRML